MSGTVTASYTSTYSEARARKVMMKVNTEWVILCSRGLLNKEQADNWVQTILYCMDKEAMNCFEVQFNLPDGSEKGLKYEVSSDGSLLEDSKAGGIDYYDFPSGTKVKIVIGLIDDRRDLVIDQLHNWGWGDSGHFMQGDASRDAAYSKDGYGLTRSKVGKW